MRMAVIGAPDYLASRPPVHTPRDLTGHDCINIRFLTHGGLYAWEFEQDGHALNVRVEERLAFNNSRHIRTAALDGFGLACLPEDMVLADIAQAGYGACWATGARRFPAITSTTRAGASTRQRFHCCWRHCAIREASVESAASSQHSKASRPTLRMP
jgi:DNA-binding transcriptional LysR family regulator